MLTITSLLSSAVNQPLISCHGRMETQVSFAQGVYKMIDRLRKIVPLRKAGFVIVNEGDPITFFTMLLALLENGNRVILPTRDYFYDANAISYYQFAINFHNGALLITENSAFDPVDIPNKGDIIAFSSGSTGTPKGILHDHRSFLMNAYAVSNRIREKGITSLTFLPPYLVSALSHFLVHFLTGSHLRFEDYEKVHLCADHFSDDRHTGVVGSPVHLTSALQFIPVNTQPQLFFSSGDFLSPASIKRILNRFPQSILYNVYGLAELAGRFFVNRIDANTPESRYEMIGAPIDGATYRLKNGQLFVKADFLYKGYVRDNRFQPADEWHPSRDLARKEECGLALIGRADDEVKILGNKVSLKHIENSIKRVLDRDVAVVLATEHPAFGTILSLVLHGLDNLRRADLIGRLRVKLKPYEIPHQFFTMDKMPFTQSMKIDRAAIAKHLDTLRPLP